MQFQRYKKGVGGVRKGAGRRIRLPGGDLGCCARLEPTKVPNAMLKL